MKAKPIFESPRITSLQKALLSDNTSALETFWQEIMMQGTPLIEAIEGDPAHYL